MKKKYLSAFLVLISVIFQINCSNSKLSNNKKQATVAILKFAKHPALDAIEEGIADYFTKQSNNINVLFYNAQGEIKAAEEICTELLNIKPDLIIPVATPAAQACSKIIKDIPVVFAAISDPVGANLVTNLEKPEANITGATDAVPFDAQIKLIKKILPAVKNIGVIYNASEANSVSAVNALKKICIAENINLSVELINSSIDLEKSIKKLVKNIDAYFMILDNTAALAFPALLNVCNSVRIPIFTADFSYVEEGALAAYSVDYKSLSVETAKIAEQILFNNKKPADVPIKSYGYNLYLNLKTAEKLGLKPDSELIEKAAQIF